MNHDYDDKEGFSDAEKSSLGQNPFDKPRKEPPGFDPFDDDTYEEPDRDTDHPGAYAQEHIQEEEDLDDLFPDNDLFDDSFDDTVDDNGLVIEEPGDSFDAELEDFKSLQEPVDADSTDDQEEGAPEPQTTTGAGAGMTGATAALSARRWDDGMNTEPDTPASWQEEDEEEYYDEGEPESPPLPMGLIAVAVLALVLLIAGGYGVIQQRKATSEEVRLLRAELATATSQQDVDQSRSALQEMKLRNDNLQESITRLSNENRRLNDTVAGLEAQLDAQQSVLSKPVTTSSPAAAPKPEAQPPAPQQAAPPKPAAASTPVAPLIGDNNWFVNFGSYGQRDVARSWVAKLNPPNGETILIATEVGGKTLYRVRVVGLSSRASAEKIARGLEQEYKLSKLWVGKQ